MLAVGKHKVKITDKFTGESKEKQTPYFGLEFTTESDESIFWIAYLSEKAFIKAGKETNMKKENLATLLKLGFKGKRLADLSDDSKSISDVFEAIQDDISIQVAHEEYDKEDGTKGAKAVIKWVNVGNPASVNKFTKEQAVVKFKDLDADLMEIAKTMKAPKKQAEKPPVQETTNHDFASEEIPF